ncbi:DUF6146 family protein [Flavobacteriaceae bacterium]|nr:DUF6146 family protein [Flavobacteriaceae bacterium]
MKYLFQFLAFSIVGLFLYACSSYPVKNSEKNKEKPVIISNDSLEYEVIIIDVGFTLYLNTIAKPKKYYSLSYLENRNNMYVTNWNIRALNPSKFNSTIYENRIDYSPQIRYGLEVNYKLFNYFQFAQQKYKIRLDRGSGLSPNFR